MLFISICSILIIIFTQIKFLRIQSPARNARKYVLRENFYVYSRAYSDPRELPQGTSGRAFTMELERGVGDKENSQPIYIL